MHFFEKCLFEHENDIKTQFEKKGPGKLDFLVEFFYKTPENAYHMIFK